MLHHAAQFGLLEPPLCDYDEAQSVILPLPFERTTSYGKGTAGGPAAILKASGFLELYDQELRSEPADAGIATLPPFFPEAFELGAALDEIAAEAETHLRAGKFLAALGGEHSLSAPLVRAAQAVHGELGVVQFDAHADLRDSYEGTPHSHACVMRRILELGVPTLALGIRSLSSREARLIDEKQLPVIWGHKLSGAAEQLPSLLADLPQKIYLTFDLDFLDPSILPATGTPEPGGGTWDPTLTLLRQIFASKEVVAMDMVELSPQPGQHASAFTAAKLLYKSLAYRHCIEKGSAQDS